MTSAHTPNLLAAILVGALALPAFAQPPASLITHDQLEPSLGRLEFKDGAPSKETVAKVYDYLDLMYGVEAFVNAYQGASVASLFKGFNAAGLPATTAIIWSELMDSKSPFVTATADTVSFWVNLDPGQCPLVVSTPPLAFGVMDDACFAGSPTSGCRDPTGAKAGNTGWCRPITKANCPGVATS